MENNYNKFILSIEDKDIRQVFCGIIKNDKYVGNEAYKMLEIINKKSFSEIYNDIYLKNVFFSSPECFFLKIKDIDFLKYVYENYNHLKYIMNEYEVENIIKKNIEVYERIQLISKFFEVLEILYPKKFKNLK
jgi:hypothetical protein